MEPTDLAYLAGFFDGEGCITTGIQRQGGRGYYLIRATVTQNSLPVLEAYEAEFGGRILDPSPGKSAFVWQITGDQMAHFLQTLLPYLRLKKEQAELALAFPRAERGQPANKAKQEEIRKALKAEKARLDEDVLAHRPRLRAPLEEREDVRRAVKLYQTPMTQEQVAETLGVKQATVSYWLRQMGVARSVGTPVGQTRIDRRPEVQEAFRRWEAGESASAIARDIGKPPATVQYWIRTLNRR